MNVDSLFTDGPLLAGRYIWIAAILLTALNTYVMRRRAPGAPTSLRHWLFAVLVAPWVLFGVLQFFGAIDTVWQLSRPSDLHLGTWIWYAYVFLQQLLITWWVLARDGARIVAESPLFVVHSALGQRSLKPGTAKLFAVLAPVVLVVGVCVAWSADFSIPRVAP
ncbi:MAG: hypothetical protein ABW136_05355 [Steroidobacteraceae bacterium]